MKLFTNIFAAACIISFYAAAFCFLWFYIRRKAVDCTKLKRTAQVLAIIASVFFALWAFFRAVAAV